MLNVSIDARVSDDNGDLTWTTITIAASDDPSEDYVDIRLTEFKVGPGDNIMVEPAELRRALDIVAGERARFMAPEGATNDA